jgi:8-oxo-dGTP pyrophosphatase MutT (NUDIX family)
MPDQPQHPENPWTTLSQSLRYDNPWIAVTEHQVRNPAGNPGIYGVVHYKHLAIGILPLDEQLNTWLVGQWRYPLGAYSWEIPEGGGKAGIDPLLSAQRELLEETGLTAQRWEVLLHLHLSNSVSDEAGVVFLARGLTMGTAMPEETEVLRLRHLPLSEAYQMVQQGEITDTVSIVALQQAWIRHLEGRL